MGNKKGAPQCALIVPACLPLPQPPLRAPRLALHCQPAAQASRMRLETPVSPRKR
ncbi:hypothetical protein GCM10027046_19550 [Uliginosibacterium flavum]